MISFVLSVAVFCLVAYFIYKAWHASDLVCPLCGSVATAGDWPNSVECERCGTIYF